MWRKYFPECVLIDSRINRGHSFGTADLDNMVFDWCKENNEEWLCKSANDVIFNNSILEKEVDSADFYYLCGFGYAGFFDPYNYDIETALRAIYKTQEFFFPQTNFYFINVSKVDYLNDKKHIDEIYNKTQNVPNYDGKPWEYGFKSCEGLLRETINKHDLLKYHLISKEKYRILLQIVKEYQIHDPSYKNIMIEGICHFQHNNQQIIEI